MKTYSDFQIRLISIIPGVGHFLLGHPWKAASLFVLDAGLVTALILSKTWMGSAVLLTVFFFLIMVPMGIEVHTLARDESGEGLKESHPYIILLLLMRGCWALPILWQCRSFPRNHKVAWSIAVPLLTAAYFSTLFLFRVPIVQFADRWFEISWLKQAVMQT